MSKGVFQPSKETNLVYEYGMMKTLKKLGFTFNPATLSDTDVLIFNIIDDELCKIEKKDMAKMKSKRK